VRDGLKVADRAHLAGRHERRNDDAKMNPAASVEIVGVIARVEVIAVGRQIRQLARLKAQYGQGHWRKLKGDAQIRLGDGTIRRAEIHWDEAHGIGRRRVKIKRFLDGPAIRCVRRPCWP
jgi:hypothetical protein